MPVYGWILSGLCGWLVLSVPMGMAVARWMKRVDQGPGLARAVAAASASSSAAEHQDVLRRGNERLLSAAREAEKAGEARFVFLCECRDEFCRDYIRLTLAEYDSQRTDHGRILYPGHAPTEDEPVSAELALAVSFQHSITRCSCS